VNASIDPPASASARAAQAADELEALVRARAENAWLHAAISASASELRQALRDRGDVAQPLLFFVVVASLFPLGLGAEGNELARSAPGLIWVCGLLAVLLSLPRLYARDAANGTLEQALLSPLPLAALAAGRIGAHWLLSGLPLAVLAPAIGVAFGLPGDALAVLAFSLLLGTPVLSMIGAIGSALALGARASPVLVGLLVLPLYVPVLIFGSGAVDAQLGGIDPSGPLFLLGAAALAGAVLAPPATALALRIAME
jgi:heme exporter protein B